MAGEPLVHFAVIGLMLFLAGRFYQNHTSTYRIVVTPEHVAELANRYQLQFGARPDPQTLDALVHRDVHDEMLFREGMALGLDQGDEIVRRRVVQKMQFLVQDLNAPREPTETRLRNYYEAHADRYATPPRVTFSHVFFAIGDGGDGQARHRAEAALRSLPKSAARAPDRGDAFSDLYDFSAYEPDQVRRLFGRTPFSDEVFTAPVGRWSGPFRSGYGWHLVHVDARREAGQPSLASVGDAVRADYLQEARARRNDAAFADLARRFTVVREGRPLSP